MRNHTLCTFTAAALLSFAGPVVAQQATLADTDSTLECSPITEENRDKCCQPDSLVDLLRDDDLAACEKFMSDAAAAAPAATAITSPAQATAPAQVAAPAADDAALGNPGNTKPVGQAGEQPSDGEWGGGDEGRGDVDSADSGGDGEAEGGKTGGTGGGGAEGTGGGKGNGAGGNGNSSN